MCKGILYEKILFWVGFFVGFFGEFHAPEFTFSKEIKHEQPMYLCATV